MQVESIFSKIIFSNSPGAGSKTMNKRIIKGLFSRKIDLNLRTRAEKTQSFENVALTVVSIILYRHFRFKSLEKILSGI